MCLENSLPGGAIDSIIVGKYIIIIIEYLVHNKARVFLIVVK